MKKDELVKEIANKTGLSQTDVNAVITTMQPIIAEAVIERGEELQLLNLGKFKRQVRAAHTGRNPMTGEALEVPETHTMIFKAAYKLRKVIETKKPAAKKAKK